MKNPIPQAIILLLLAVSSHPAATRYVSLGSANPQWPYATWATAATNLQAAVDASNAGDTVLVTNGVYTVGWRIGGQGATRVVITNATALRSINGPQFTVISGAIGTRCAYLADGASLSGFTLTNGASPFRGGGVVGTSSNAFVTDCVITGNSASGGGGGAYSCTLSNSTLTGNVEGGGACSCTLYNCTLSGNAAANGGGASKSTLYHCTLSGNSGTGADSCNLYNCTLSGNSGGGASQCTLSNCTLSGNEGSGAFSSTLYNCTLTGNSGDGDPISGGGGGASVSTLYNCTLSGNSAYDGGGAWYSKLSNCTLTGNSAAGSGGGVSQCALYNCTVYFNTAPVGPNYDSAPSVALNYCCTIPMPTNGVGNITNAPLFVDYASGNLHLQSNSPCINAGNNAYVTTTIDLDGNPRIVSGTVDIGAYEYQGAGSVISYAWLQQYGLPTDGSADYADPDHDGLNNRQEWVCGTNPTNALSALRMVSAVPTSTNTMVTWQSVAGVNYLLERSATLSAPFALLATNFVGQASTTTYADTNTASAGSFFYRVGVKP